MDLLWMLLTSLMAGTTGSVIDCPFNSDFCEWTQESKDGCVWEIHNFFVGFTTALLDGNSGFAILQSPSTNISEQSCFHVENSPGNKSQIHLFVNDCELDVTSNDWHTTFVDIPLNTTLIIKIRGSCTTEPSRIREAKLTVGTCSDVIQHQNVSIMPFELFACNHVSSTEISVVTTDYKELTTVVSDTSPGFITVMGVIIGILVLSLAAIVMYLLYKRKSLTDPVKKLIANKMDSNSNTNDTCLHDSSLNISGERKTETANTRTSIDINTNGYIEVRDTIRRDTNSNMDELKNAEPVNTDPNDYSEVLNALFHDHESTRKPDTDRNDFSEVLNTCTLFHDPESTRKPISNGHSKPNDITPHKSSENISGVTHDYEEVNLGTLNDPTKAKYVNSLDRKDKDSIRSVNVSKMTKPNDETNYNYLHFNYTGSQATINAAVDSNNENSKTQTITSVVSGTKGCNYVVLDPNVTGFQRDTYVLCGSAEEPKQNNFNENLGVGNTLIIDESHEIKDTSSTEPHIYSHAFNDVYDTANQRPTKSFNTNVYDHCVLLEK